VDALGVTAAYTLLGCAVLLLCPVSYILIREKPEDMGLTVDGAPEKPKAALPEEATALSGALTVRQILSYRETWIIGISFGITLMMNAGVISQLKPRFVAVGMGDYEAMTFMCLTAAFGAAGKYGWGWICDRISPLTTARLLFMANTVSLAFILLPNNLFTTILFVCTWGFAMGGTLTVLPAMVAQAFGREKFPSAYKVMALFIILKALGYPLVGISFDLSGSYDLAYIVMMAAMGVILLGMCAITEKGLGRIRDS
jgi:cyanate permease